MTSITAALINSQLEHVAELDAALKDAHHCCVAKVALETELVRLDALLEGR